MAIYTFTCAPADQDIYRPALQGREFGECDSGTGQWVEIPEGASILGRQVDGQSSGELLGVVSFCLLMAYAIALIVKTMTGRR